MDEKQRAKKDLEKLSALLKYFASQPILKKYKKQTDFAKNYEKDAIHFYEKKDYFTSFGCANYAYGILEGIILKEKGKTFHEVESVP